MNPCNVINLLTDIVRINLDVRAQSKVTSQESEGAQYLFETLKSFENATKFNYQE
jgi:hypothetical protein